ncbi:hypothetical protein BV898_13666 [Hypsibius exemplaris]|uniref:RIB43A-like with coiled-coils protein 2 n=1 Tax=Hypsibius exemplaris TaxID=2072580 RepID=A0A1W0W9X9_HYPEX|nr:hypothetical protein BV898_13666 [Hypsibius exemplaris]
MSYFLKIPEDKRYAEKMERKKQVLAERGKKIFDPVLAHQAYDTQELSHQVTERRNQEREERVRDQTFDKAAHRLDAVHQMIAQKEQEAKKSLAHDLLEYRRLFQKKEFESDKIRQPQDLKNDILRQRDDLARQMNEEQMRKDHQRHLDNVAHTEHAAQGAKLENLAITSQELQKALKLANKNYNQALATHQAHDKRRTAALEEKDRQTHMNNTMNSHLLNEVPNNKRDHKGISEDQHKRIYECWDKQKHEIEDARNQERQEECTWSNYFRGVGNDYSGQMKVLQEERVVMRRQMDLLNRKHVVECKEREDINKVIYGRADPTEAFFDQFQKDPR